MLCLAIRPFPRLEPCPISVTSACLLQDYDLIEIETTASEPKHFEQRFEHGGALVDTPRSLEE